MIGILGFVEMIVVVVVGGDNSSSGDLNVFAGDYSNGQGFTEDSPSFKIVIRNNYVD